VKQTKQHPDETIRLVAEVVPDSQELLLSRLQHFRDLILKVNQRINLVSRQQSERIVNDLIFDSVALLQFIRPHDQARVLDLGAGAGLPGLVIAATNPQCRLLSVEANRRKIEFQRQVVRGLGLSNVELVCERIEKLQPLEAEIAVAKAFASTEAICCLTESHVKAGADLFLPRSADEQHTKTDFQSLGFELVGTEMYQSATDGRNSQLFHLKKL